MAALNDAVIGALTNVDPLYHKEIKRVFGDLMGEVITQLIDPAIKAFPELSPDDAAWREIATSRAKSRAVIVQELSDKRSST